MVITLGEARIEGQILELSFSTELMRSISTDIDKCTEELGMEIGRDYISVLADFRAAFIVSELPYEPVRVKKSFDKYQLTWQVALKHYLITNVYINDSDAADWKSAYRIELERIEFGGRHS